MNNFTIGQAVKVSDRRPKPPKHHSKKLKEWERNHFNGVIEDIRLDKNCVLIENTDMNTAIIAKWRFEISLDDPIKKIEPIILQSENF